MSRYIAFLRAINVGGRVITMNRLRGHFESLGFSNVETFIASGNVIFESRQASTMKLQGRIQKCLRGSLGYEVAAILRTDTEVAAVAEYKPFSATALKSAAALNVAFVASILSEDAKRAVARFQTEIDDFHVNGREVYWLCKVRQSESRFSAAAFEKAIACPATFRNINTVRKLAAKYSPKNGDCRP